MDHGTISAQRRANLNSEDQRLWMIIVIILYRLQLDDKKLKLSKKIRVGITAFFLSCEIYLRNMLPRCGPSSGSIIYLVPWQRSAMGISRGSAELWPRLFSHCKHGRQSCRRGFEHLLKVLLQMTENDVFQCSIIFYWLPLILLTLKTVFDKCLLTKHMSMGASALLISLGDFLAHN